LKPGVYTVESDEPLSFRGQAFEWTQMVTVPAGGEVVLELGPANADAAAGARVNADSAAVLAQWRDSVVEIWAPTKHAAGFIADSGSGLIVTTDRALGGHTSVEVQLTAASEQFKVPGRVVVADYQSGAAFVWVNPQAIARMKPIDLKCGTTARADVNYQDSVVTIAASVLGAKEVHDGQVTKVTPQAIFSNMRIGDDAAGGPVFAESGDLLGISSIDDPAERRRWNDAWIVPVEQVCAKIADARAAMKGTPPADIRLPLDPPYVAATVVGAKPKPAAARKAPVVIKASDFDITIMTAQQAREVQPSMTSIRTDFGTWSQYVRDVSPVLLVRVSPQFEEAMWKTLARGYAFLQGIWLGPFRSFTANFQRMRAYCGSNEVLPIHPFIIEHPVPERSPIREGLYVFDRSAFGPHCKTVRFVMYSEKSAGGDTKDIDPKLFEEPE
ncbi:MAG TPA: hypothetical protein VEA16_13520, partial [Vicinamibacterales bacterium]|nr:hypothetical protein [Vicinamibacterales bacterium]